MPNYSVKAMLLQLEGIVIKSQKRVCRCGTAIYGICEILAYLRAKQLLVISIARNRQLNHDGSEMRKVFLWRNRKVRGE